MIKDPQRIVYLLDISFFIFRAYHALPPLTTSAGVPTNAVHGVSAMLEKLIRDKKPRYLGACFDTARATFRRDLFPAYKANRLEPDPELKAQFPYVRRLIAALEIPVLDRAGFEADDILASLARRYEAEGFEVVLVTGDKDLMQCVTDHVSLLDPMRDLTVRNKEVAEKFGVGPQAVPEVLGLMGDSSDNIPGVKGIGPKTATALIAHFGTIEEMLARTEEIEKLPIRGAAAVRKKIEEGAEMARLCRVLALVRRDLEIEVEPADLALGALATDALDALAGELEMTRLVPRMKALAAQSGFVLHQPAEAGAAAPSRQLSRPETKPGPAQGQLALGEVPSPTAVVSARPRPDLPPAGAWRDLSPGRLFVAYGGADSDDWVVSLGDGNTTATVAGGDAAAAALADLAARGASLVGHDLKTLCRELGARTGSDGFDLSVASYLCDTSAGDHSLEDVCTRFLGEAPAEPPHGPEALEQIRRGSELLAAQLEAREQVALYRELEHPLIEILAAMESHGMLLDSARLRVISASLEGRMNALVGRIYEAAGGPFNILSPIQLREILFTKLGLPSKGLKSTKSGPSTDSESLESLADKHPLPALILEYRGMAKLKSTYADSLPRLVDEAGRVHTRLNQTVTATGRLSSSDPNLQNIPIRTAEGALIRGAFIAPPGSLLVSADYNQIELRVLAHLSEDENLIEAFREGLDIHRATSADLFGVAPEAVTPTMRRDAKVVNFGIIYGMGPGRLSRELGISRTQADEYIKRYFAKYPGVRRFYGKMLDHARAHGFVATLYGRRRYLPDISSEHGGRRQMAERVATNTPIQGSAADIIKRAMVALAAEIAAARLESRVVLQIHDELLLECPAAEVEEATRLVAGTMERAARLLVPIVVDVGSGHSWAEAHE
ncbi:MAG: DNA polymerase I [Deltaproteobacteria bacterium]|nr:DNA polymerase I [Deltaproteobacteria bacterium]